MQRTILAVTILAAAGLALSQAAVAEPPPVSAPTPAEVHQHAMQHGPSTGRIGYLTHKDPPAPTKTPVPVNPELLRPLSQREIGMLFNACVAYAECATAYSRAYEHNQAQQRAAAAKALKDGGQ